MKKRLIILVALVACIATAQAQVYVGGSVGFTTSKIDNGGADKSGSSFKLIPDIGYKMDDNLSIGVMLGYSHGLCSFGSISVSDVKSALSSVASIYGDINDEDMKLNSFTVAPYLRYSALRFGNAAFFFEGYVGYSNIKSDSTPSLSSGDSSYGGSETSFNAFELGVRPGISYSLGSKVDVICKLGAVGFVSAKEKESDMKITRFGVSLDSYNVLVGFNFNL
ncbi:MAG: porin family protein [Prevotella sp.]|nr:porin family protein [Prevotella sp.]